MAESSTGLDKWNLLERSQEALQDAFDLRKSLLGDNDNETIATAISLAATWRLNGKIREAEELLLNYLAINKSSPNVR